MVHRALEKTGDNHSITMKNFNDLVSNRTGPLLSFEDIPFTPGCPELYISNCTAISECNGDFTKTISCNGSGLTQDKARALAYFEAIERSSTAAWRYEELVIGSYRKLEMSFPLVNPADYALYQHEQYSYCGYTPFTIDTHIGWIKGYNLSRSSVTFVPACLSYIWYKPQEKDKEYIIGRGTSSGAACGTTYAEALTRAICEIAEREAILVTWWNQLSRRRIIPHKGSWLASIIKERFQRPGIELMLLDISTDFPIAIILGILLDNFSTPPQVHMGASAGFDVENTALKAIMEAVGSYRARPFNSAYRKFRNPDEVLYIEDHASYYWDANHFQALDFLLSSSDTIFTDDFSPSKKNLPRDQLETLISFTAANNIDVVAIDMGRELADYTKLKVARVILPQVTPISFGHLHRCLGGKRLYEMPVKQRLVRTANTLSELNPNPHPFA